MPEGASRIVDLYVSGSSYVILTGGRETQRER